METRNINYIDETLHFTKVNGLKLYILPKKDYVKKFAMITVDYGSNDIAFSENGNQSIKEYPLGIAHFLEHKLFEEKEGNIFDKFSKLGASPNAYTNFENTAYYFTCTENFYNNLELLIHFVFNPYFTEENVNKEKGIIEQEIKMYEDNPGARVYYNALRAMYNTHPIRNDIAGDVESIYKINSDLLYECYNTFYNPNNMIMVVVGDVDKTKILKIAEGNVPKKKEFNVNFKHYDESPVVDKKIVEENLGVSIPNFIIGFKDNINIENPRERLKRKLSMNIAGKLFLGRSSSLYEDLYHKGLINESFSYDYTIEKDYAHFLIGGESKEPREVNKAIISYFENRLEVSIEEFKRVKKSILGSYMSSFNSIEGIGNFLSRNLICNIDPFEYKEVLNEIEVEDIINTCKAIITDENNIISIIN